MSELSWGIWAVRLVLSLLFTAGLSFLVADYVVKAHTASSNEAMRSLQASIETLNGSVLASTAATDRLEGQMSELLQSSVRHSEGIAVLQTNVSKIATAVQDAGIAIRIGAKPEDARVISWMELQKALATQSGQSAGDFYVRFPKVGNIPQE